MNAVYYTGVWDLLHIGHVIALQKAASMGLLIVGVVTDEFAAEMKRVPMIPFDQRCQMVSALWCVDEVVPARGFLDFDAMEKYGVTIRAIGPDYGKYPQQQQALELMEEMGIEVVRIPRTPGISTTDIIRRVRNE